MWMRGRIIASTRQAHRSAVNEEPGESSNGALPATDAGWSHLDSGLALNLLSFYVDGTFEVDATSSTRA